MYYIISTVNKQHDSNVIDLEDASDDGPLRPKHVVLIKDCKLRKGRKFLYMFIYNVERLRRTTKTFLWIWQICSDTSAN
jgi:hypothetical protein